METPEEIKKALDAELEKVSVFNSGDINAIPINSDLGVKIIANILASLSPKEEEDPCKAINRA